MSSVSAHFPAKALQSLDSLVQASAMGRSTSLRWALLGLWACGESAAPAPSAVTPPAPAAPAPAPASPAAPNPCDNPAPLKIELKAGVSQKTPWDIELKYVIDEDPKLGAAYMFLLQSEGRRWETRRDHRNWKRPLTWRGFCWRVAERPPRRALTINIEVAPVCKDGKLQELGGCGTALDPS